MLFIEVGSRDMAAKMVGTLGMLARALGKHERAARLFGASLAQHGAIVGSEAAARRKKGPELAAAIAKYEKDFKTEWAHGQAMTLEQAVDYALEESEEKK